MKNLAIFIFVMLMCAPKMSLDLGSFDWTSPAGQPLAVNVELYNNGDTESGADLEPNTVRQLLDYAWTACGRMVDCDPYTREAFVIVDPTDLWLIFYVEDKGI